eukprot:Em0001g3444a
MESPALLGQKWSSMVLGAASRNIEKMIIILSARTRIVLSFNRWYLDDGVLSGHSPAVTRAVTLIQEMGPSLGLFINVSKCELFGHGDLSSFPPEMKVKILGAPIGDPVFVPTSQKRADAVKLLSQLAEVGAEDPQVAFLLLRQCATFCKLVHLAVPHLLHTSLRAWLYLTRMLDPIGHHALTCKHGGSQDFMKN